MPSCNCDCPTDVCIEAAAPMSRCIDANDCVQFNFEFCSSDTVDHYVAPDGSFKSDVIVSADAEQCLEVRDNGLYVPCPETPNADNLICTALDCDCNCDTAQTSPPLDNIINGCNGLEVRDCDIDCETNSRRRLWAPPPIREVQVQGFTSGVAELPPIVGGALPAGTPPGVYSLRSLPATNANGEAINDGTFEICNEWCYPATWDFTIHAGAFLVRFEDPNDTWDLEFYRTTWRQEPGGGVFDVMGEEFVVTPAMQTDDSNGVMVSLPTIRERPVVIQPGDCWKYRVDIKVQVDSTGSSNVTFPGRSRGTLFLAGYLRTAHDITGLNVTSL